MTKYLNGPSRVGMYLNGIVIVFLTLFLHIPHIHSVLHIPHIHSVDYQSLFTSMVTKNLALEFFLIISPLAHWSKPCAPITSNPNNAVAANIIPLWVPHNPVQRTRLQPHVLHIFPNYLLYMNNIFINTRSFRHDQNCLDCLATVWGHLGSHIYIIVTFYNIITSFMLDIRFLPVLISILQSDHNAMQCGTLFFFFNRLIFHNTPNKWHTPCAYTEPVYTDLPIPSWRAAVRALNSANFAEHGCLQRQLWEQKMICSDSVLQNDSKMILNTQSIYKQHLFCPIYKGPY